MDTEDVIYHAPVIVTVDLDARRAVRVMVDDTSVTLDSTSDDVPALAIAVAEQYDWPAWEIG